MSIPEVATFAQTLVLGVMIGGVYALMAVGLNLIFGVMRIANFAHGVLYMAGGYAGFYASHALGTPFFVSVLLAMVAGAALGFAINAVLLRAVYRRRLERPSEFTLIVTFAVSLMGSSAATALFSPDYRRFSGPFPGILQLGPIHLAGDRVTAFATALLLCAALLWIVARTDVGRGWRALTQNTVGAAVVGIDVFRLANLAFATSGALAAAAGAVLVPLYLAYPTMGDAAVVKSFVIVVLGGLGSVAGSLVGGVILGVAEALGSVYLGSGFADVYGFAIMLLVLLFMPEGLFGAREREL